MAKKWKTVGGFPQATLIKVNEEVDAFVEGIYKGCQENVGPNNSKMHYIEIDGELCSFWGSDVLDKRLAQVHEGDEVRITYKGKAKSNTPGRKGYYDYTIEVAEEDGDEEEAAPAPKKVVKPAKKIVPETEDGESDEDEDTPF